MELKRLIDNNIPPRNKCLELIKRANMPENILKHSLQVEKLAVSIGKKCIQKGYDLNLDLIKAGALLHDIAKAKCIEEKCNHATVGGEMVKSWGYPAVACIVEQHIYLCMADIVACPTEALIVNYADKRVMHDTVVSLDRRFSDLLERYGKTEIQQRVLKYKWQLYKKLEKKLRTITDNSVIVV